MLRLCLLSVKIGSGGEPKTVEVSLSVVLLVIVSRDCRIRIGLSGGRSCVCGVKLSE